MQLSQVCFPVYRLTRIKPIQENGVLLYRNFYKELDTNNLSTVESVIDDTNIPGSFSMRRLKMKALGIKLYSIKQSIFMLSDFIKLGKSGYYFIDSNGVLFKYVKTTTCKLIFKPITKVIPAQATGDILEVQGEHTRFRTLFKVPSDHTHAGILYYGSMPILYGTYDRQYKPTTRKI